MTKKFLKSFYIAGFGYYQGAFVFHQLKIGTQLLLKYEHNNIHDDHAVAIYYHHDKIGFVPRNQNRTIFALLAAGYQPFECVIQKIDPTADPAAQVIAAIFVVPPLSQSL